MKIDLGSNTVSVGEYLVSVTDSNRRGARVRGPNWNVTVRPSRDLDDVQFKSTHFPESDAREAQLDLVRQIENQCGECWKALSALKKGTSNEH